VETIRARLGSVAVGQHALITAGQLADLKITRDQRAHLLATGHIVKVAPHVYLVNGAPFTWQARIAAAWLALGAKAVVSHRSAAALYSLEGFDQQKVVHLSVPTDLSPRRRKDVQFHRCLDFELIRSERRQNILVTDPARLILDLYASERNPEVARRGLFSARKKKLVTWAALEECLEQHARKGRRRMNGLRSDLDLYRRTGCPETSFEDAIRQVLMDAGLPEPELQHWVATPGGRYRIDVAFPELRVGIEGKSKKDHLTDDAFESDPVRDAELGIAGWIIIHVTWAQLHGDPAGVVRRVKRALVSRSVSYEGDGAA
jgi:very-short-patch-repair endonuclease